MKILGIDYGDKRTGVSVSDESETIARPLCTIEGDYPPKVAAAVLEAAKKEGAAKIVVGLPINMNGTEGPRAEKTRLFAAELAKGFGGSVEFADERLSTVLTNRIFNETDTRSKKRKGLVDKVAASVILQSYLDRKAR